MAARPKTLYAAAAPVAIGGALARDGGRLSPGPLLAALAGALLIQIGTNFANDLSDYLRGADRRDRVGFVRVTQSGLVTPGAMRWAIGLTFGLAALVGLYLIQVGGWPILVIGLAAIGAGLAYTGGPWPFGYHGLGEPFVFLFFGPVAVGGTYYVQALDLRPDALLAGVGIGALITAILVVNNLRDRETDARAGKRTLAVRLGLRRTRIEYTVLLLAAAIVPPLGIRLAGWPAGSALALAAAPFAVRPLLDVWSFRDPRSLNGTLAGTSRLSGIYALLFVAGFLL